MPQWLEENLIILLWSKYAFYYWSSGFDEDDWFKYKTFLACQKAQASYWVGDL